MAEPEGVDSAALQKAVSLVTAFQQVGQDEGLAAGLVADLLAEPDGALGG